MRERAFESSFEGGGGQSEHENDPLTRMRSLLAIAVQSRRGGELDKFGPKQAEATRYINEFWPGDKLFQIEFLQPAQVFERDGLAQTDHEAKTFLANRHAGFGARGALFVNDATNESVYVFDLFGTELDFIER